MTTITLKFWAKGTDLLLKQQAGTEIQRVYVNRDDGESLGFWERRVEITGRGNETYYDRHRHCKGDAFVASDPVVRFVSDTLDEQAVLTAIGVGKVEIEQANKDIGGGLFVAVARKARNGHPSWYGNTPKKEKDRLRKERDNAVFTLN